MTEEDLSTFTLREFKDVLYHTALVTPTDDESDGETCNVVSHQYLTSASYVPTDTVPEPARFPFQGYGEINVQSIETAVSVLAGDAELPARSQDDLHYQRAYDAKRTLVAKEIPEAPSAPAR